MREAKDAEQRSVIEIEIDSCDDFAVVTIRDSGSGIPDDECETVIDKFVQSNRTKSGAGGTGLGLSICREIVLLHGGSVRAVPTHGRGALLELKLPHWRSSYAEQLDTVAVGA